MAKKPQNLIYGVNDKPPFLALLFLGVQHVFLMSSTLILPVVLVTELGGTFEQVRCVVALTMIACGIGTILQAVRWRFLGAGFVCPNLCGPNFFLSSMEAAWLGGLPLMRGMTIVAGLVEAVFSRFVDRLKFLFPPEITGLVVLMVAEGLVPLGVSKVLGINYEGEPMQGERENPALQRFHRHVVRLSAVFFYRHPFSGELPQCDRFPMDNDAAFGQYVRDNLQMVAAADVCHRFDNRRAEIVREPYYVRESERRGMERA
jgi:xanthine/uracil permease